MSDLNIDKAIAALRATEHDRDLHPMRQQALKTSLMERITKTSNGHIEDTITNRRWMLSPVALSILIIIASCSIATGVAYATQNSLPGETLHPLKLAAEQIQSSLTPSEEGRAHLEARHATERLKELSILQTRLQEKKPAEPMTVVAEPNKDVEEMTKQEVEKALNLLEQTQKKLESTGEKNQAAEMKKIMGELHKKAVVSKFKVQREKKKGDIKVRVSGSNPNEKTNDEAGDFEDLPEENEINENQTPTFKDK